MFVGYFEIADQQPSHQPAASTTPQPIRQNPNDTVQSELECSLCQDIPLVPVITPVCQHVFCRPCVEQALELRRECPNDRQPLERRNLQELSGALRRVWEAIPVRCPKNQCTWSGTLGNYLVHVQNCNPISVSEYEQRIAALERKVTGMTAQHEREQRQLRAVIAQRDAEKQNLQASISQVKMKLAATEHSNSKPFDSNYRYDRFRIVELAGVICRDLEKKPSLINPNKIFNCVKDCYDDYERGYSDNPEHMHLDIKMLLHVCNASTWFSEAQRNNIRKWIRETNY